METAKFSLRQVAEGEVEKPGDDGGEKALGGAALPGPRLSSCRRRHSHSEYFKVTAVVTAVVTAAKLCIFSFRLVRA